MEDYVDRWLANEAGEISYLVEANSFETGVLYERYKDTWKEVTRGGPMATIGHIDNRPVNVTLNVYNIEGGNVMFYHPCSQVVDYKMVEDWLTKKFPQFFTKGERYKHTDAQNFHNAVHHIIEQRQQKQES